MESSSVNQSLLWQSDVCKGMGAPLTAEVLRIIAEDARASAAFAPYFAPFAALTPKDFLTAAFPLRALGALHFLVLSGQAPALAAFYASGGGEGLAGAVADVASAHPAVVARFVASPPQTNEVRRSLCLFGGFLTVAHETGLPLRCLELGASAGLNQFWDRFEYDLGVLGHWGDAASPVKLFGDWTGDAPPLQSAVRVAERSACDQNPIDVHDSSSALHLLAYIWPDQPDRLARARAAIDLARVAGVQVDKADAAAWTARHAKPAAGIATVLYHSVFWQYPSEQTREAIRRNIEVAGLAATTDAPFAWLRMEPAADDPTGPMEVRLTLWPNGKEHLLAKVHSHGAAVHWLVGAEIATNR